MSYLKKNFSFFDEDSNVEGYMMAVFIVIIIISGNFLTETLGCQFQKILNNMIFKNILIYFTIYFTIELSSDISIPENPLITAKKALAVWLIFKFFTRMNLIPTICVILLGSIMFVISQYREFLKYQNTNNNDDNSTISDENIDQNLAIIQNALFNLIFVVVTISFFGYFIEKRREYKKNFSFLTFLFGVKKCKFEN